MKLLRYPAVLSSAIILCALLIGCPSSANVSVDYNHNVNFAQFKTFSFAHVKTDNPFFEDRVKQDVTRNLDSDGLRRVSSDGDLQLTAVGAIHDQQEYQTFYNNPGFGFDWWDEDDFYGPQYYGTATTRTVHYRLGTLVLDMYNGRTKKLVWRGTASNSVTNSAEVNTDRLRKAIHRMLRNFPPSTTSS